MVQSRVGRGGRAAEGAGLENQYGIYSHRGFESHPLRQFTLSHGFLNGGGFYELFSLKVGKKFIAILFKSG